MEADDLLCSRNARSQTPLVGRAQWKINQPPSLKRYRASLEGAFISFDAQNRGSTRLPLKKTRGIGKTRAVGIIPPTPYKATACCGLAGRHFLASCITFHLTRNRFSLVFDEVCESAENVPRLFMCLWVGGRCRGRRRSGGVIRGNALGRTG